MPKVAYRQIRTRGVYLKKKAFRDEVVKTINGKSKPELIAAHNRIVSNWRNKPEFKARKRITKKGITIFVYASGDAARIWGYVTGGTKPHTITPKRGGYPLRFKTGYKPKTKPPGKFGGPGAYTGPQVRAMRVRHPGTKARRFEQTIADDYKRTFQRDIENAMRRGLRRARGK